MSKPLHIVKTIEGLAPTVTFPDGTSVPLDELLAVDPSLVMPEHVTRIEYLPGERLSYFTEDGQFGPDFPFEGTWFLGDKMLAQQAQYVEAIEQRKPKPIDLPILPEPVDLKTPLADSIDAFLNAEPGKDREQLRAVLQRLKTFLGALVLMVCASPALALDHYSNVAQDQNGRAIVGASITVYQAGTTTTATIYADNGVTTKANPFTTGIDGIYDFYAADGLYDIKITKAGYTSIYWDPNKTKGLALFDSAQFIVPFGQTFPASPSNGSFFVVIDDDGSCVQGSGSSATLCRYDSTVPGWVAIGGGGGGGGAVTGWPTDSTTKVITWANSLLNAVRIGDGTTPMCHYTDATLGPVIRPCTDSNVRTLVPANFTWCWYDLEAAACAFTFDPDAATPKDMYLFTAAYRPLKTVWFGAGSLSTDGTQCANPAEVTINSGPKIWTIICTDNDASTIYGSIKMPNSWDGGTLTFIHSYIQTAANTAALHGDIAAQCRGNGEAVSSTWGTEVAIDDAGVTGSNRNDFTASADVTPAGTCVGGDMLYWRYQLDATGTVTAVATLHHVGFSMRYAVTSLSD